MEFGEPIIDGSFVLKRMLWLMCFFFLMFILKEKQKNYFNLKKKGPEREREMEEGSVCVT